MFTSGPTVEVTTNIGVPSAHLDVSMPHAEVQVNSGYSTNAHVEMHGSGMDIHTTSYGSSGHVDISGPRVDVAVPTVHANIGSGYGNSGHVDMHVGGYSSGPSMEIHGTGMHTNVHMPVAEVRVSGGPVIDARVNTNVGTTGYVNLPAPSANVHVGVSFHIQLINFR